MPFVPDHALPRGGACTTAVYRSCHVRRECMEGERFASSPHDESKQKGVESYDELLRWLRWTDDAGHGCWHNAVGPAARCGDLGPRALAQWSGGTSVRISTDAC